MPGTSKWSYTLRFPHQSPEYTSPIFIHATCPAHLTLLYFIARKILCVERRSLSSSLYSFPYSPVTSSLLGPNILLSTHVSNSLSLGPSLNLSHLFSHPCKTKDKIKYLHILISKCLDNKLEDKRFCTER